MQKRNNMEQTADQIVLGNQIKAIDTNISNLSTDVRSTYIPDVVAKTNPTPSFDPISRYSKENRVSPVVAKTDPWSQTIQDLGSKRQLDTFSPIKDSELYATLSDGSRIAKFEDVPSWATSVSQLEENEAQNQTTSDKWLNGLPKFLGKIGTAVLGGTVGSVNGIIEMAKTGSFQAVYDNKYNDYLNDLNTKMDYKLPNYYTEQEKSKNILQSLDSANFWANDVLGGASFTVGAIVSEGLWAWATGGTSLATTGARLGLRAEASLGRLLGNTAKVAEANNKISALVKAPVLERYLTKTFSPTLATNLGKAGELLNTARFTYTSSGFESGQEAANFMRESRENFAQSFEAKNGRVPGAEDFSKFESDLTDSANGLFAFNMAIVGSSNLAMFGSALGVSSPVKLPTKWANETFFGIGSKRTAAGVLEELAPSRLQNIAAKSFSVLKAPLTEGLYEEGLQSVGQNTAKGWIQSTYDPKYTKDTLDMGTAFTQGMAETFGSKEGWKEIGIGMIIGLLSGTGVSVASGQGLFGELKEARRKNEDFVRLDNQYNVEKTIDRIHTANRINSYTTSSEVATRNGDYVGAETSRASALLAHITHAYNFGNTEQASKEFNVGINTLDFNLLKEQYGFETEEEANTFKETLITEYKDLTKEYKKNRDFVGYMINSKSKEFDGIKNIEEVKEAVAFELTLGKKAYDISGELLQDLTTNIAKNYNTTGEDISTSLQVVDVLTSAKKEVRQEFTTKQKELKKLKNERIELEKQRLSLEKLKNSKEDNKADLNRLNKNIVDIEENIVKSAQLEKELNGVIATAQLQNPYNDKSQVFITSDQLTEIDTNLESINEMINTYKSTNPALGYKLEKTLKEYKKSKIAFTRYADLSRQLSDPTLGLRGKRNIIKELSSDKTPTEATLEFIESMTKNIDRINEERATEGFESTAVGKELETMKAPEETKKIATVKDIIKNNPYLLEYVGEEENPTKPSDEELIEYKGLLQRVKRSRKIDNEKATRNAPNYYAKKGIKIPLNSKEMARFQELNQKVSDWRLFEGAFNDEGISLADLIEQELSRIEVEAPLDIKTDITNDDLALVASPEEVVPSKNGVEYRKSSIIQTYENVKVRVFEDFYEFSHLKASSILNKIKGNYEIVMKSPKEFDENGFVTSWEMPRIVDTQEFLDNENRYGTIFNINTESGIIPITVANYGKLQIPISNFSAVKDSLGLDIFKQVTTNTSYSDLYESNENGEYKQKESDFKLEQEVGIENREYTPEEVLNSKPETRVFFKVNMKDSYNQELKAAYEIGEVSLDYVINQVKVYNTAVNGKILGDLKSNKEIVDESSNFLELRRIAAEILLNGSSVQDMITLPYTTKTSYVLLGTPNLTMVKGEDGVIPQSRRLSDAALGEIVDYGYTQNGELKLKDNTGKVRTDFISKLAKKSNVPVIVFKQGEYLVAYPVTLNAVTNNSAEEVSKILSSKKLNNSEKVTLINSILSENGIKPDLNYITADNQNMFDGEGLPSENLKSYIDILNNKKKTVNVEDWLSPEHDKESLKEDVSLTINLEERVLKSPKMIIDFDGMEASSLGDSWYDNYISTGIVSDEKINEIANKIVEDNLNSSGLVNFDLNDVKRPNGALGTQGVSEIQANDLLKSLGVKVPNVDSFRDLIEHLKNNKKDLQKLIDFTKLNPIHIEELPDGTFHIKDGHHRATLLYYSGVENVEVKLDNAGEFNDKYTFSETSSLTSQEQDVYNKESLRMSEAVDNIVKLNAQKQAEANNEKNNLC